ncbi:MAG TPA: hypothetical protein VF553_02635 [Pyrinomonadaceae bacterium]|jgi:ketosteroid isomerase-like protein
MKEEGQITSVNSSEKTSAAASERTVATPYFDAAAIKKAKPAVPLARVKSANSWPTGALLIVAILAGLAGGILGGILPGFYMKEAASQRSSSEQAANGDIVAPGRGPEQTTPSQTTQPNIETQDATTADAVRSDGAAVMPQEMEATLRGALNDWVAATNARDIDKQMTFYNPVIDSFYRMRNASRADVRADKARVFERASSIDIRTGAPDIRIGPDGRTAIMRFHKRYAIEGEGVDRRGEVVQELRWQLINGAWRIVSERDVRVVR